MTENDRSERVAYRRSWERGHLAEYRSKPPAVPRPATSVTKSNILPPTGILTPPTLTLISDTAEIRVVARHQALPRHNAAMQHGLGVTPCDPGQRGAPVLRDETSADGPAHALEAECRGGHAIDPLQYAH